MTTDHDLDTIADPTWEQYFLVNQDKIDQLLAAAGIRPTDHVVEIGAGVGTIARHVPTCASLTVIELDERLIGRLRANVPTGTVIHGDGVALLPGLKIDVLLSNLPNTVTENQLLPVLPQLRFRTAILAVGSNTDLNRLADTFDVTELTTITAGDFRPPQPSVSRLVQIRSRVQVSQ